MRMTGQRWLVCLALCCGAAAGAAEQLGAVNEQEARERARTAFYRGDYTAMAAAYGSLVPRIAAEADALAKENPRRLASYVDDRVEDCMGLGHAQQLAGDWRQAVAGYQHARALVELALKARGDQGPASSRATLIRRWAFLLWLIGRIQRDALDDPAAAAATLAHGSDFSPFLKRPMDQLLGDRAAQMQQMLRRERLLPNHKLLHEVYYPLLTMHELAATQERLGRHGAALQTLTRADLASMVAHGPDFRANVQRAAELVRQMGAAVPRPRTPFLAMLSPGRPRWTLRMDDPRALAGAYRVYQGGCSYWHLALCPPPGKEFAAVEFACDIEQLEVGFGGHFRCHADSARPDGGSVQVGSISWHGREEPGREVVRERFEVPPGSGLLRIEVGCWKDKFTVHNVTAQAEFRESREARLPLRLWMQTEMMPEGGVLTCAGRPAQPGVAFTDLEPGRYVFEYRAPGHPNVFRCEPRLVGGGQYGLFANLDSPFRWALTTLRGFGGHPPPRASLARLRDGGWLVAYGSGSSVKLAASNDGVTWAQPWTLPQPSLIRRIEPTLHIDAEGTLWLAYFSDRLRNAFTGTGGYNLWVRRSRDGRTWSPPKPVAVEGTQPAGPGRGSGRSPWRDFQSLGGWPWGAIDLTQAPDGRHWLFWRGYVGCGAAPDQLGPLRKLAIEGVRLTNASSPHVTFDAGGRLHLDFSDRRLCICYATSADGERWAGPVTLCELGKAGHAPQAQLVLDGERAALLYGGTGAGFLRRGVLEPEPRFGPAIQITNHVIPTNGSRAWVGRDGEVRLLAGKDTVWLLRAHRRALAREPVADF